jgi:hypothetical protein
MRDDFDAIPDPGSGPSPAGTMLTRIYHDIGLAAVADALDLLTVEFSPDLADSIERGEFYIVPTGPTTGSPGMST